METEKFINLCKNIIADYENNNNLDEANKTKIDTNDVFVVWYSKTLQNNKALLSTTLFNGMYYELTLNGDKQEIYLDAYKKCENKKITL